MRRRFVHRRRGRASGSAADVYRNATLVLTFVARAKRPWRVEVHDGRFHEATVEAATDREAMGAARCIVDEMRSKP